MTRSEALPVPPDESAAGPGSRSSAPSRRGLPVVALAVALAVVLLAGGAAAWWLFWSSPVEALPATNVSLSDVEPGDPRTVLIALLCLSGTEAATIDRVTADPAGLTVTDFAARPGRSGEPTVGTFDGTLRESGFGGDPTLTTACADHTYDELAVEVTRGVDGPAHTEGFHVHWRAGVRSGVLTVEAPVTLCAPGQVEEHCGPVPPGS